MTRDHSWLLITTVFFLFLFEGVVSRFICSKPVINAGNDPKNYEIKTILRISYNATTFFAKFQRFPSQTGTFEKVSSKVHIDVIHFHPSHH